MVGKTLGHYEILEPLGAGGMGEVYRARDRKLKREVAIKVLPQELSADPDRLARLEREAHLLAALNHANIATIHALEEEEGTRFLVLELVKGESLEQRLSRGPLPVENALEVCKQIAEALEAAHNEGIVHRDLKPANVLITPEGNAKVLDFGLAKEFEAAHAETDMSHSPTVTVAGTQAGVILGTAPYMSPEQIRGHVVDKRADIWAFGCVLYEALTGRRAFDRETVADTLAAILDFEPEWNALPVATPVTIQSLLRRCLRKNQDRRLRDIGDARIEIDEALKGDTDAVSAAMVAAPAVVETKRGNPWKLTLPVALATLLVGVFGTWFATRPAPRTPESPVRFEIELPEEVGFGNLGWLAVAISPDGSSIVFAADGHLWMREIGDLVPTRIPGTEGATTPFFSPNGQEIGFWDNEARQIKKVAVIGGAPIQVGAATRNFYGASWADDDMIYFGQWADGIWKVPGKGGIPPEVVIKMDEGERADGPQLLPGGEWLLFTLGSAATDWSEASIVAQSLVTGRRVVLIEGGTDGRWVPTGHLVYALDGTLLAVPFDPGAVERPSGAVPIVDGIRMAKNGLTPVAQYGFGQHGGLVYVPGGSGTEGFELAWVDRDGKVELLPSEPREFRALDLSPDGQRVALEIQGDDGGADIWIYDAERGGSQGLLTREGSNRNPVWSPDGEWVFFSSDRGGNDDIWKQRVDRSLDAERVLDTDAPVRPNSISADGEMLLFSSGTTLNHDIGILPLGTGRESMLVATPANEAEPDFSPDGRFFAFHSNETGQFEVYVQEVETGKQYSVSESAPGGSIPRWSREGGQIYYSASGEGGVIRGIFVAEVEMEPFSSSEPLEISNIAHRYWNRSDFDVTADGQRFLVKQIAGDTAYTDPRIHVILNWFEELKRLVPTGR